MHAAYGNMAARVTKLCAARKIPQKARKLTRFDGPGDAAIVDHLQLFARQRLGLQHADDVTLAARLLSEARRWLRGQLIDRLKRHGLEAIAAQAAAGAGLAGAAERVAYCLVVLYQKQDPPRGQRVMQYGLTLGKPNIGAQLRFWAQTIAANMRADGQKVAMAQASGARGLDWLTASLRRRSKPWQRDVADWVAEQLWELLALRSPGAAQMTLAYAHAHDPPGGEYVYQREFDAWVGMKWKRERPRDTTPLEDQVIEGPPAEREDFEARDLRLRREAWEAIEAELERWEVEVFCAVEEATRSRKLTPDERADLAAAASESADMLRSSGITAQRPKLDPVLERRARELWLALDAKRVELAPESLGPALAQRAFVLWQDLDEERAELPRMLRYIDVTMRGPKEIRRLVAALSLRRQSLEPALRDHLAAICPALLADLPVVPDDDDVIAAEVRARIRRAKTDARGVGTLRNLVRNDLARQYPAWGRAFERYGYARGR